MMRRFYGIMRTFSNDGNDGNDIIWTHNTALARFIQLTENARPQWTCLVNG